MKATYMTTYVTVVTVGTVGTVGTAVTVVTVVSKKNFTPKLFSPEKDCFHHFFFSLKTPSHKSHVTSLHKKLCNLFTQKKITQPLHTQNHAISQQKITQTLLKKITQPLRKKIMQPPEK